MSRLIKRTKNSTNAKKRGILRILSAPARYIKSKIKSIYKKQKTILFYLLLYLDFFAS